MKEADTINGKELKEMFAAATDWLEKSVQDIDALNVFPVPDGDTGTNMLLTMRSSIDETGNIANHNNNNASEVGKAMAKGALMGARGNSGVILSQIWRGLARGLEGHKTVTGATMAQALQKASEQAYKAMSKPTEGTILTVIRETAGAAIAQAGANDNMIAVMEAALVAAKESVANTPTLLPVLREAGVVDAGGQGLYTILEGALHYLKGEGEQLQLRRPWMIASNIPLTPQLPKMVVDAEAPYGYCTEFLIKGEKFDTSKIRAKLEKKGQSLIVVGDEAAVRVHIHSIDPGSVIRYATSLGTVHQMSIRNMDEQHQDYIAMQQERRPMADIATVAVVSGDGLSQVFTSLGAAAIAPGGQTMNPSTRDLLQAVESVPSDKVIILPNNKNIILTAQQVPPLTQKQVVVVPTETIPQGIAALLAFDYEADLATNTRLMQEAKSAVKTIEITRAVRSAHLDGLSIKKNQNIGLLDGELLATGNNTIDILNKILARLNLNKAEIFTIYYGGDTKKAEAEQIGASVHEKYPQLETEVVKGGQPYYNYIVSIE